MENIDFYLNVLNRYIDKTQEYLPLYAMFEITNSCNFRCGHCYIPSKLKNDNESIDKNLAIRILDELKQLGCIKLLITGGEAILHPHFFEIYRHAYDLGFVITLFSNGYNLDAKIISFLDAYKPDKLEITLYGWNEKSYSDFTKRRCAYQQVGNVLQTLVDTEINFDLKVSLTTHNVHHIQELNSFADRYGKKIRYDGVIINSLDQSENTLCNRLDPYDVVQLEDNYEIEPTIHQYSSTLGIYETKEMLFKCGAGKNSFCINARGELYACAQLRIFPYDLSYGSLLEGIRHFERIVNQLMPENMKCRSCTYIDYCRYCPGRFLLESGSMFTPPKWYCEYGKLGYEKARKQKNYET